MVDAGFLHALWSPATPLWAIALGCAVIAFRGFPSWMARWNERRRDAEGFSDRLLNRYDSRVVNLEARCEQLERREEECRHELALAKERIAELEGYNQGRGKADQEAAGIVATERAIERRRER